MRFLKWSFVLLLVFNTGRQLRREERSSLAWDYYNVFKGGSEAMARSQLDDFFHPERQPDWVARYKAGRQWKGTRESLRRTAPRSPSRRTRET